MEPVPLALVLYSVQILFIVGVAAASAPLTRSSTPAVRLLYWRGVAAICLAAPLLGASSVDSSGISVAFEAAGPMAVAIEPPARSAAATLGGVLLWTCLCGIAARLAWLAAGAYRLRQLRRRSEPATLDDGIERLRAALAPRAEIRWSSAISQPLAFGIRPPVILLPPSFNQLTSEGRSAVACHELLHAARRDWIWIVIEELLRTLFWFHPAVWWLVDQVQLAREQLIDRLVVERTAARKAYMGALITFADRRRAALSAAFLRRHHLRSRLQQLSRESEMSSKRLVWTLIALAGVIASTAAAARAFPLEVPALPGQGGAARLEIRLAETTAGAGLTEAVVSGSNQRIYLHPNALATDADVASARAFDTGGSGFAVAITLNPSAAARITAATSSHIGRPMAILLDGSLVSAPTVRSPIGESAVLTGIPSEDAAKALAAKLARAISAQGADRQDRLTLPVPIAQVKPAYTPEAMSAGIEGSVLMDVVVLADGSVGDIAVVRSLDSTHGLDRQAVDALRLWKWKPGTYDGQPQRVAVSVEMTFTLK